VSDFLKIIAGILLFLASLFWCSHHRTTDQVAAPAAIAKAPAQAEINIGSRVTLLGEVDSEARRAALVTAARATHGDIVDDQLTIAANTSGQVLKLSGAAADSGARDALSASYTQAAGSGAEISNQLAVPSAASELKQLLELKPIEFVSGQSIFTENGKAVADEVAAVLARDTTSQFEVAGHTDSLGERTQNLALSQARAEALIQYLQEKGLDVARFTARGYGPDKPVADNATREGRQRNRRIEFVQAGG
jgi:outer membrane protein OmpA-like peptidoglycan-associated protein